MDSDHDGEISSAKIDLSCLKGQYLTIFKPLLEELAELEEPLDQEEFQEAANRLYDSLNQNDKNLILRFGTVTKEEKENFLIQQECTFKPKINWDSKHYDSVDSKSKSQRPQSGMNSGVRTKIDTVKDSGKSAALNKSMARNQLNYNASSFSGTNKADAVKSKQSLISGLTETSAF